MLPTPLSWGWCQSQALPNHSSVPPHHSVLSPLVLAREVVLCTLDDAGMHTGRHLRTGYWGLLKERSRVGGSLQKGTHGCWLAGTKQVWPQRQKHEGKLHFEGYLMVLCQALSPERPFRAHSLNGTAA